MFSQAIFSDTCSQTGQVLLFFGLFFNLETLEERDCLIFKPGLASILYNHTSIENNIR